MILTRNLPKSPIVNPRKSILQAHGFELTKVTIGHAFENRLRVKVSISPPKPHVRRSSEVIVSESKKKLKKFFELNKNPQGKVILKDFFDHVCKSILTRETGNNLFNMMKGKLYKEINFKELKEILSKAAEKNDKKNQEIKVEKLSEQEFERLKEMFFKYDLNADGFLSLPELKKALRDKFSMQTIESMFTEYDTDSDGLLSLSDFVRLCVPESVIIPSNMLNS